MRHARPRRLAPFVLLFALTAACGEDTAGVGAEDVPLTPGERAARTLTEGFIDGCAGNQILYQKWSDDGGAYATLVFASGRTEYTDKYHHLLPLIDRNLDVVFFDHIGQGRSDGVRAHVNDVDAEFACDLQTVVQSLVDVAKPKFLLSHSMGGLAAIRALQLTPNLVDAAAFSAPMWGLAYPDGLTPDAAREIAHVMLESGSAETPMLPSDGVIAPCEEAKLTHDCALYNAFKDDPMTHIGASTWGAGLAFLDALERVNRDVAAVAVPLLVLSAGDDAYVDADRHPLVCDAINAATPGLCTLETHPDAWHELLNEVDRAQHLETVLGFFDAHLPR